MKSVKRESIFRRLSLCEAEPSDVGREQFRNHQSVGALPIDPDPYFVCLSSGKSQLDFLVEEWTKLRHTEEWPGWYQLYRDFWNDEVLFKLIFPYCKKTLI